MHRRPVLKEQNRYLIWTLLVGHGLTFVAVSFDIGSYHTFNFDFLKENQSSSIAAFAAFAGVLALVKLLLLGQVTNKWRNRMVHWRWTNPKPGSRAFTVIGPEDDRVSMRDLERLLGPLPTDPRAQNATWYKLYLDCQDQPSVEEANRTYLAAREVTVVNALLALPLAGAYGLLTEDPGSSATYFGCVLGVYALTALAAQNYARRLVENVLALASAGSTTSAATTG